MKRIVASLLAGALALSLVACGGSDSSSAPASTAGSASTGSASAATELSGAVTTGGSTSVESVIGILTEAFKEIQRMWTLLTTPPALAPASPVQRGHAGYRPFQPRAEGR